MILNVQDRQWKTMVAGSESWGDNPEASRPNDNTWARLTVELQGNGLLDVHVCAGEVMERGGLPGCQ